MTISWDDIASGAFTLGSSLYGAKQGRSIAQDNLNNVQGSVNARRGMLDSAGATDLYNKLMAAANSSVSLAGNYDPKVAAAERYKATQDLLAPGRARDEQALLRKMHAKGLLGTATYGQAGAPAGQATNPYSAGLSAAQAAQDSSLAVDSLKQGEDYLNGLLNRSSGLYQTAAGLERSLNSGDAAVNAAKAGVLKAKGAGTEGIISGLPGMFGSVWKGVGGFDGLRKLLGGGGATGYTPTGNSNFNPYFGEQSSLYTPPIEYPTFDANYGDEWSTGYNDYGISDE